MRITCPTCSTQYDVDENDIAFTGQDVQCTECMTIWTQTRDGEASNPRSVDSLVSDGEEIVTADEETPEIAQPESETSESVDIPSEDTSAPTTDEEVAEDTQDEAKTETEPEDVKATEADSQTDDVEGDDPDGSAESEAEDDATNSEDDDEENPIWKEIAALAQEARADAETMPTADAEYSPPDDVPPIQSSPAVPDEGEPAFQAPDEDDRPWDAAAEVKTSFSDFVWEDPSKENESGTETEDRPDADKPEFTPLADTSGGPLEQMDDNVIAAALNEQMAIEDAIEDTPRPERRDISDVPVELGGPRARIPNVEALKHSVRAKSVQLTSEELQEQVPARRFRRGFTLILLVFVILGAIYISRGTVTQYVPEVGPYLETYAGFVDLLRTKAEVLGVNVWGLVTLGYDGVIAKFF